MKKITNFLPAALLAAFILQPLFADTRIKLSGRKDVVLSPSSRAVVLDVARQNLSEKSDDFLMLIAASDNPFLYEQPTIAKTSQVTEVTAKVEEVVINYDDASVLRVVAQNFSSQVRGTLVRGSTSFLQLRGGNMIKPGTSFPVTIPQAQGQTFTVTVSEITGNDYTLQIGEATQTISLNASGTGGGAIKLN
jgi:hypothetical protein